jgi:energy-coupling factor transporter ATP-binding protein EcfA2
MGASDTGKTTLCVLLAGLAPRLTGGAMEGRIIVTGRDTQDYPPPALADTIGVLFQEPDAQLFNPTVEAEIAWGLENLGVSAPEIETRVDQMLTLLHLSAVRYRYPGDLSGGEKKRLALASVLAMRPAILILDEPMGGLDPMGKQQVLEALRSLRQDRSATIVMTESDPEAVAAFADRLIILRRSPRHSISTRQQGGALSGGCIALEGVPRDVFCQVERLDELGVAVPQMARVASCLSRRLNADFSFGSVDEARQALASHLV